MSNYLSKLKGDIGCELYAANNVSMGIKWALEDKKVQKYPEVVIQLETFYKRLEDFPVCYRTIEEVDRRVIIEVSRIQYRAYQLICDL